MTIKISKNVISLKQLCPLYGIYLQLQIELGQKRFQDTIKPRISVVGFKLAVFDHNPNALMREFYAQNEREKGENYVVCNVVRKALYFIG